MWAILVYRAAQSFLQTANIRDGVAIHLEKRIPLAAGLGAAAATPRIHFSA